jgi:hypothetical protein
MSPEIGIPRKREIDSQLVVREIKAVTECAVLLIEAAEMQSAAASYCGARKGEKEIRGKV